MMEGPLVADSEEKHEPVSDIDTVVVDSLKALDPEWPIREADDQARYSITLVVAGEQRRREFKPKCLRGLLLNLNLRFVRSSREELLAAVDVVGRARECCVAHDVNG